MVPMNYPNKDEVQHFIRRVLPEERHGCQVKQQHLEDMLVCLSVPIYL